MTLITGQSVFYTDKRVWFYHLENKTLDFKVIIWNFLFVDALASLEEPIVTDVMTHWLTDWLTDFSSIISLYLFRSDILKMSGDINQIYQESYQITQDIYQMFQTFVKFFLQRICILIFRLVNDLPSNPSNFLLCLYPPIVRNAFQYFKTFCCELLSEKFGSDMLLVFIALLHFWQPAGKSQKAQNQIFTQIRI